MRRHDLMRHDSLFVVQAGARAIRSESAVTRVLHRPWYFLRDLYLQGERIRCRHARTLAERDEAGTAKRE